jgi:hypothetical protein
MRSLTFWPRPLILELGKQLYFVDVSCNAILTASSHYNAMLLPFRPTDDIWPLHLLDLSDENHLSTTYKLLKFSPLALKFYLDTFVFPLVLGECTLTSTYTYVSDFWIN